MKKVFFLIQLYSVLLWAGTVTQGEIFEYYLQGEYSLLHNNYIQAESDFSKALYLAPDSPSILQSLVDLKVYKGEYADAIMYLEKIIELMPNNKESGLELIQLYIQEGNLNDAHELLDALLEYYPDDIELLHMRANIQYSYQDWSNLLKTYHLIFLSDTDNINILLKIYEIGMSTDHLSVVLEIFQEIRLENETPLILELLVEVLLEQNELSKAIFYLRKLIEIDDATDQRFITLGELYLYNRQFDYVITTIEPIYKSGNHSLEILKLLSFAYSNLGKSDEQIAISLIMTEEYPELSIGYEALAIAYLEAGDEVEALNILHQALNQFPDTVTIPRTLAKIYYQAKNYIQAEKYFVAILDINPKMFSIQHALAILFEDMLDTDRSDSLFNIMIEQNGKEAVALNDYAYIIAERHNSSLNELNYALELAKQAITMEPNNAAFLDTIGWIYFKMGNYNISQQYMEKSLNINEDNPVILEHMGDIYHKLDAPDQALLLYKKALFKDIENKIIQEKINQINDQ